MSQLVSRKKQNRVVVRWVSRGKQVRPVVRNEVRGWRRFIHPNEAGKSGSDTVSGNRAPTVSVVDVETGFPGTASDIKS
jgi:hypothetical protein